MTVVNLEEELIKSVNAHSVQANIAYLAGDKKSAGMHIRRAQMAYKMAQAVHKNRIELKAAARAAIPLNSISNIQIA